MLIFWSLLNWKVGGHTASREQLCPRLLLNPDFPAPRFRNAWSLQSPLLTVLCLNASVDAVSDITVCNVYDAALKADNRPHVVVDMTMSGAASETAKSITAALSLPTVSASFGQEGDLRYCNRYTSVTQSCHDTAILTIDIHLSDSPVTIQLY